MGDSEGVSAASGYDCSRGRGTSAAGLSILPNIGETYDMRWFTFTSGKAGQANLFGDEKFWRTKFLDAYKKYSRSRRSTLSLEIRQ